MGGARPSDEDVEKLAIADLMHVIVGIQPDETAPLVTDPYMLEQWLRAISKSILEEMLTGLRSADNWGFDYNVELTCKECGTQFKHALDLNPVNFFFG
jgi:hypothetical protein